MEYRIVQNELDLELQINQMIQDGWVPIGGLCSNAYGYAQAMTRATKTKRKPVKKFVKPTQEEIGVLVKQGLNLTGFYNYYESKGWKVGKTPMKDWKAAARGWSSRQSKFSNEPAVKTQTPEQKKQSARAVWEKQGFKSEREWSDAMYQKQMESIK